MQKKNTCTTLCTLQIYRAVEFLVRFHALLRLWVGSILRPVVVDPDVEFTVIHIFCALVHIFLTKRHEFLKRLQILVGRITSGEVDILPHCSCQGAGLAAGAPGHTCQHDRCLTRGAPGHTPSREVWSWLFFLRLE